jgi:gamma-polyglutamate biosynthesis protein CapA
VLVAFFGAGCSHEAKIAPSQKISWPATATTTAQAEPKEVAHVNQQLPTATTTPIDTSVSLFFVGDAMFDRTVRSRTLASKRETYPFEAFMKEGKSTMDSYDLQILNLEGPVTSRRRAPEKSIDFLFEKNIPALIKRMGFDAVSQANNHALDQGREGEEESRRLIREAGLAVFGDEVHDDASSTLAFIEAKGQKIALLGFNITDNPLDKPAAEQSIVEAKKSASHIIVYMHWGEEYHAKPTAAQVSLAHWFIDHEVDAVIGAHPHWMQSVEVYKNKPIAYSLGNFIFDQDWSVETNEGLAVGLTFVEEGSRLDLYPVRIRNSQPRLLEGEEKAKRLQRLVEISDPTLKEQIVSGKILIK